MDRWEEWEAVLTHGAGPVESFAIGFALSWLRLVVTALVYFAAIFGGMAAIVALWISQLD